MKRVVPYALIGLAATGFTTAVIAQETAEERSDRGIIVRFIEDNLSSAGRQVILRDFEGALSSRATATQLTIADEEGIWLTLNDIVLDWNRSAVLGGRIEINELTAGEIIVARAPITPESEVPAPEAAGFALPELPVSVQIAKVEAARVLLGESLLGQEIEGRIEAALTLDGGAGSALLQIERQDAGPDGQVDLSIAYSNTTQVLSIALDVAEDAGGIAAQLLDLPGQPSVALSVKGDGPLDDFVADIALSSDGASRLAGRVALKGTAAEVDADAADAGTAAGGTGFSADLRGDLAPLFMPEYADFLGPEVALVADGVRSADGALDLSKLALTARSLQLQGQARIAADGLPEFIAVNGSLADPTGKPVILPGSDASVRLQSGILTVNFDAAQGEDWTAVVDAMGVASGQGAAERLMLDGKGRIARTASGQVVEGAFSARATGIAATDPAVARALGREAVASTGFSWQQQGGGLQIRDLELTAGPIRAQGNAEIAGLDAGFETKATIRIEADDIAPLSGLADRALSGRAVIEATGAGSPLGGEFDVQALVNGRDLAFGMAELDNLLRGESAIRLDMARDATGTVLRDLALRAPGLVIEGVGAVSSGNTTLDLTLDMDDVGRLGPPYSGAVRGKVQVDGPLASEPRRARIAADLDTTDLRIGIAEADGLLEGAARLELLADLVGETVQLERLVVTAPDSRVEASGSLALAGSDVKANLALGNLGRIRPGFGGGLTAEASFAGTPENGQLNLSATGSGLRIGQQQADRLLAGNSQLSGQIRMENGALRVDDLTVENPQLSLKATGQAEGNRRDVNLTARLANLSLLMPEFPGAVTVTGRATDTGNGYDLQLSGTGPGGIDARVAGQVAADFASANLTVQGAAQAGLANPFLGTRVLAGPISADLRLNGPLALSSLSGRIGLSNGRLVDPTLPFALEGMDIAATLSGGRAQLTGSTRLSSGGLITVAGPINMTAPYVADLAIALQGAVIRDPELYQTRANGELRVAGALAGGAAITGRIALPETEIRIAATGMSGQEMIDGLRHVGDTVVVRETRRRAQIEASATSETGGSSGPAYPLDITISAPNQLFIRGRGLDAELGGTVRVTGTTANVIPSGAFELIRGRLDILGRRLTLSEASLFIEGDFNPAMRIVASSENEGITSSVVIAGNAAEPEVSFTSTPELPQEEVLAHLLFGRRLDNLSALQALQLANAVATLAGQGGEGIVSKLRQGFGLDDLDVQTDAAGNAQLTAGKYLSENVYSEVQVDGEGKTQINLNLDLTDNVTVKGNVAADGNTGIGIFYQRDY